MRFLPLVWSNLKRRKTRTLLTVMSILVAFLLFGYLAAIRQALSAGVSVAGADRLVVRHKVSIIQLLPESYESQIEAVDGVVDATHQTWFGGVYQDARNFFPQIVVKPAEYMAMYPEFVLSPEERQAWLTTRDGAVVGRGTADRFGWHVGDRVPIQATIWQHPDGSSTWEFEIVGIYEGAEPGTDTSNFFFRYDYFDEGRLPRVRGQVGWYTVKVADPDAAGEVSRAIDARFANSPAETRTETELAFVQGFANQIGNIGAIMMAVLSAVFFTILLVAGNTMAQAVRERIQELGVLKAVGYTDRMVTVLVLLESCVLALLGGGLGLGLASYLISLGDPTGGALAVFFFPRGDLLLGAGLALGLGLLAGLLPALQAMRLSAVDALRRT